MLTLAQSARVKGKAGEKLPALWQSLEEKGAVFRRGQLCLVVAGPGSGKSALVLTYALLGGVSGMYFSADSNIDEQLKRALSIIDKYPRPHAERIVDGDDFETIDKVLSKTILQLSYEASPSPEFIQLNVNAYAEKHGDYPELIVIDNALDVRLERSEDGSADLDEFLSWVHDLARKTSACVIVLHHVNAGYVDSDKPIPLSGIKNQLHRVPELILSLVNERNEQGPDIIRISTIKNRGGPFNPSGEDFVELDFDGYRMQITDQAFASDPYTTVPEATRIDDPWSGNVEQF